MLEKAPPASARLPGDSRLRAEQLSASRKWASRLRWHPQCPQHPQATFPAPSRFAGCRAGAVSPQCRHAVTRHPEAVPKPPALLQPLRDTS